MHALPTPHGYDLTLSARDGYPLAARVHEPAGPPRAAVVLHGATATPRRYYDRFAAFLAGEGFRVLTYDYRGIGGSRHGALRQLGATMEDWAALDAVAAHEAARARSPGLPLFAVAHSFGG